MGNATGVVNYDLPEDYDTTILTVGVPSYRGIENPFGHIWSWVDGCKCRIQSETDGGLSEFYACEDPQYFQDTNYNNYELRGVLPRKEGYIKEMIIGEYGEFMPLAVGAGSTTYFSDYFYTNIPASGEAQRGVLFGGSSYIGACAGVGCSRTIDTASYTNANIGSRLCFLPGV